MNVNAEFLKLKRTLVWPVVLLSPLVPALINWGIYRRPQAAGTGWDEFVNQLLIFWALLLLPLVISLLVAQVVALEHGTGSWRPLLALPRKRAWAYLEKVSVLLTLTALLNLLALVGMLLAAYALPHALAGEFDLIHIAMRYGFVWVASFAMTLITLWVALRFASFLAPSGFGAAATVMGFALVNSERYGPWWPWNLAAYSALDAAFQTQVASYSLALAGVAAVVTLLDFSLRDF